MSSPYFHPGKRIPFACVRAADIGTVGTGCTRQEEKGGGGRKRSAAAVAVTKEIGAISQFAKWGTGEKMAGHGPRESSPGPSNVLLILTSQTMASRIQYPCVAPRSNLVSTYKVIIGPTFANFCRHPTCRHSDRPTDRPTDTPTFQSRHVLNTSWSQIHDRDILPSNESRQAGSGRLRSSLGYKAGPRRSVCVTTVSSVIEKIDFARSALTRLERPERTIAVGLPTLMWRVLHEASFPAGGHRETESPKRHHQVATDISVLSLPPP
ncbi:hypothetical protein DFP72DRAFT_846874 [Ephemerocybe angulata]|uniref:Uncharacterized protein n=1 Tax=Ephemerocybe angulata TaxID=980116 RepID=A0A8H6I2C4_9AGAR|nr:hypothetical protein DFP72DRAFT_846874 [Tulosesus angulatus]